MFKCILWPQWLAYAFSLQVSEGFEQRRRWRNLIKRQHGKDGISTVVSSEYFRKEDIRKTLIGRWELATSSELSPPSSPPPQRKKNKERSRLFIPLTSKSLKTVELDDEFCDETGETALKDAVLASPDAAKYESMTDPPMDPEAMVLN